MAITILLSINLKYDFFPFMYSFHILLIHGTIDGYFICWDMFVYSFQYFLYVYYVYISVYMSVYMTFNVKQILDCFIHPV